MKKHLLMLFVAVMAASMSLNAQTIIIDDGFENGIQDSVWTQEFAEGNTPWMVEDVNDGLSYPNTVKQGTKRAYLRNTTGETQGYVTRLVSKVMDLRPSKIYQPELSFWYANPKWTADRDTLRVLYRTGAKSKWKQLAEYSTASANWQRVNLELPEVNETYQIAFEGKDNLGRGIVLDSVKLRSAPECTVPHDIIVNNKGANKVNISWVASWDANFFELVVSKDTIDPNMIDDAPVESIVFHGLISGLQQNYDITLESDEFYLVYIRSLCENETSIWSSELSKDGPFGFRVRPTKQIPYSYNFTVPVGTEDIQRDPEWAWGSNTGNKNPYINTNMTSASQRAYYSLDKTPCAIFSGATNPSTVIPADKYVFMATPAIADTTKALFSLNQCQVRFWSTVYIYTGRNYARSIIVGVMTDPEDITTFVPVDTVSVWGNKTFQENIVDLGSYTGHGAYVAFVSDFDRQNLFYIDDVTIEYKPAVNKVTKISVNPRDVYADIAWEGNASSYNVLVTNAEVDPSNPDAAAIVAQATVNTNSYHCTGLEADHSWNRPYYVYVKAQGTEWSYRYPFVTIASKRDVPFSFDFESASGRYRIGTGTTYYPTGLGIFGNDPKYPGLSSANVYKGSGCLFLNKTAGADSWITLPMVEGLDTLQVKFFLSGSTTFSQSHASLGVMTNPMDINTFHKVADFMLSTTGYTMCYANFENYSGPDGVIAIVWDDVMNMSKNTINYIDELRVERLSECVPPSGVDLDVEADSITSYWNISSADMWEVVISRNALTTAQKDKPFSEIKTLGSVVYADTVTWDNPSVAPRFGFGGLTPQTTYYFYVRTVCYGDAAWWTEIPFTTPCPTYSFPYHENFENYSGTSAGCWELRDYIGTGYPQIYTPTSGATSGKQLYLYSYGSTHRSLAMMPAVEGSLSNMMLAFDARSYSTSSASVLYVGTIMNIDDYNSFVPFDTINIPASSEITKVRLLLSDYDLVHDNIVFTTGVGPLRMNSSVLIDNVGLVDPTCIDAYDIKLTYVGANNVEFAWSGESRNNQWGIKVLDATSHTFLDETVITGKSYNLQGLEPSSSYEVYLRALCGDSTYVTFRIHTACEALNPALPNKETFESYALESVPDCWTVGTTGTSVTSMPYVTTHGGSKILYLHQSSCTSWAASPEIDCDSLSSIIVSFSSGASLSTEYCVLGVMTDPLDLSTFVALDSVVGRGSSAELTKSSFDLSAYEARIPAGAKHIAWRGRMRTSDYVYLDDVSFSSVLCPATKPSYSEVTESSVRIASGLRTTDTDWQLLVTTVYIDPDSLLSPTYALPDSVVVYNHLESGRSQVVPGLESATKYYVATAAFCDSIFSRWNTLSFSTPCAAVTPKALGTITFSEAEGYTTGTSGELPCWMVGNKTSGASSSYIPYVDNSTTFMHKGNNYLRLYDNVTSSSMYVGAYAIMPELAVGDTINKFQVSFWGRGYSSYNSQIIVGVVTDPSDLNTFVAVDTVTFESGVWNPYSVGFDNYDGDFLGEMGRNVMFLSEFGVTNYAYLSEISVELIPKCRPIASFTVDSVGENSAVVSWKGYQDRYRMLVSDIALTDEEKPSYDYLVDSIVDHSSHIRLTNMQPATNYYVYAQGICEEGDSTAISMLYASIRTECPTTKGVPVPFYEDFESYDLGKNLGCWVMGNTSPSSSWPKLEEVSNNGTKAIDVYSTGSNGSFVVVPKVDASLQDLQLAFDARTWSTSASSATLHVGTMSDPNDPTTFVTLQSFPLTGSSTFSHYEITLADFDLAGDYLAFSSGIVGVTTPTESDIYLDNVSLAIESLCHAPKLRSLGTDATTAHFQIIPTKEENIHWEYAVIPDSVRAKIRDINAYLEKTATLIPTDSVDVVITGLEPATSYYIYARTNCGEPDGNSPWIKEPLKVTTQFYYKDSYLFGFEKSEQWERSQYSASDNYYIHPALETGRDTIGYPTTSYGYYPYSLENTVSNLYAHTGRGALCMFSSGSYYGGYVIFPPIGEPKDRSFSFKARAGYLDAQSMKPMSSYNSILEIGTIDKNTNFDTYKVLAYVRLDSLTASDVANASNHYLYQYFTLDVDSTTMATKQMVIHMPHQPLNTASIYIDDVTIDKPNGINLVSLENIVAEGSQATVEWAKIGGPWNLYITTRNEEQLLDTVAEYLNLTESELVVKNLNPRTDYTAVLAAKAEDTTYVTTTKLNFRTLCLALKPDANGEFVWDFDDPYEWEQNDVLQAVPADTAYFKPACFTTGVTYSMPVDGYQWLMQPKGYNYFATLDAYGERHFETGRNDSQALRVYTSPEYFNSYLVLPELGTNLNNMMIEFYGRCFANYDETHPTESVRGMIANANYLSEAYSQSIVVGTLSDPHDFSTLEVIDTLTYRQTHLTASDNVNNDTTGLRYWELMQLPLEGAKGKYIVLFQPAPGLFFLDDLAVKPVGNTLFAPSRAHTTDITATSARLSWTVRHPDLSSVVVVSNATGDELIKRDTVAGTSYVLTDLVSGSSYQWYVYQTDLTNNTQPSLFVNFATECVAINPDYTCGFELEDGWTNIPGQPLYKQSLCWTYSDAMQAKWKSATYDPFNQPNTEAYRYSRTDSFAVAMRGSFSASYQPYIALPAMDVEALDTLQITFWMRPAFVSASTGKVVTSYTGASYSKSIVVGTMTDPTDTATFVPLDTVTYDGSIAASDVATPANNWLYQPMKVELTGAAGPYVVLMTSFYEKGDNTRKNNDYIWIDDIAFMRRQECKDPKNLEVINTGAYDATLAWEADEAQAFVLQVSTDPYFADDGAFAFYDTVYTNPYTVTELKSLTPYYWRVQAVCDETKGESSFSRKASFTTARSPFYLDDFAKNVSNEWIFSTNPASLVVDSMIPVSSGNNSYGFSRSATGFGLPGSHYVAPGYYDDYHWMITPSIYLPMEDSVHFSLDVALTACNTSHMPAANPAAESDMKDDYYFMIILSDDGGATWKSENILAKWQNTNPEGMQLRDIPSTGMKVRYSLAQYAGKHVRIGFYREAVTNSNTGIAIHVDNARFAYFDKTSEYTSACQYEDIQIGDIVIPGDDIEPGIHSFPTCYYASTEEAASGARDSVYAVEIEVFPTPETEFADTICQGDTYSDINFADKETTGTYRRKLQTMVYGCDSIVTLHLYVTPRAYAEDEIVSLCPGETYWWNDKMYNRAGIFRDTLVSAAGCDSIETLVLSYYKTEDTIKVSASVLTSELPYTYVNEDHPYVPGQAPIYYPVGTAPGTYSDTVRVEGENCVTILVHRLRIIQTQDIDNISDENAAGARKLIYRDNLYIILNDEWYNAEGKKVADPRK